MNLPMPVEIDDVTLAFPAQAVKDLMPAMKDIPENFRARTAESAPWFRLQEVWFFQGMHQLFSFQPAVVNGEQVNALWAYRHLAAIQRSFAPRHEHKMAAVAWLASLWMESVIFGPPAAEREDLEVAGAASLGEWLAHFEAESSAS